MVTIQASFFSTCLKRRVNFNAILPLDSVFPSPEPQKLPLMTIYLLHGYTGSR